VGYNGEGGGDSFHFLPFKTTFASLFDDATTANSCQTCRQTVTTALSTATSTTVMLLRRRLLVILHWRWPLVITLRWAIGLVGTKELEHVYFRARESRQPPTSANLTAGLLRNPVEAYLWWMLWISLRRAVVALGRMTLVIVVVTCHGHLLGRRIEMLRWKKEAKALRFKSYFSEELVNTRNLLVSCRKRSHYLGSIN
jgi:hypothetical protein